MNELRAEWTKLRSVPRWVLTLGAAVVLTVVVGLLSGSETVGGEAPGGRFVPLDGELVVRVASQRNSHPLAKAGLVIRAGDAYAALVVTPRHGVQLLSDSGTVAGSRGGAPRWLKLTRSGTGYESADGEHWERIGAVEAPRGTGGLFVGSPDRTDVERRFGAEEIVQEPTAGAATFEVEGRRVALTGSGDLGPDRYAADATETLLSGALVGLLAIVTVAVLFVTSEYARGTILTTFAASPRRVRVLVAKAAVVGAAAFAAGLVASLVAFALKPPEGASLADWPLLRAVVGTAGLLAAVAIFSVGVATIVRRGAVAIALVVVLLLAPQIVATGMPLSAAKWLERVTPSAGFSIQQTIERYDSAIGPWPGLAVLCGYAAVALAIAGWRLRRLDA